jgi:general secretion pathway protein C
MPVLRREGDEIGCRSVIAIGWDRVWLARDGTRCQIELGRPATPATAADRKAAGFAKVGPTTPAEAALTAGIRSHIHKTGEREVEIDRTTLGEIVAHYPELVRRVRLAHEKAGVRLFGIQPGSVLETLGLVNGDRLESINGFDVRDPREAIEAYARLQSASQISLAITRAGKKQTLDVHIR